MNQPVCLVDQIFDAQPQRVLASRPRERVSVQDHPFQPLQQDQDDYVLLVGDVVEPEVQPLQQRERALRRFGREVDPREIVEREAQLSQSWQLGEHLPRRTSRRQASRKKARSGASSRDVWAADRCGQLVSLGFTMLYPLFGKHGVGLDARTWMIPCGIKWVYALFFYLFLVIQRLLCNHVHLACG